MDLPQKGALALTSRRIRTIGAAILVLFFLDAAFHRSTVFQSRPTLPTWSNSTSHRLDESHIPYQEESNQAEESEANPKQVDSDPVDWSGFAYVQYVTNTAYLCNSVMLFEILHRLGSKADRLMMFPKGFDLNDDDTEAKLLLKARDEYGVKLKPIEVQRKEGERE